MPPKIKYRKEDIIDAAFNLVRKSGWKGLSARSIAKELNASTGPIYSYLDSMKDLDEEVVGKAMELFTEYIINTKQTGDKWIDHGIGYTLFAKHEHHLFRGINDENHLKIQKKYAPEIWEALNQELSDYPLFEGLSEETSMQIRNMRWIFIHGLATLINNSFPFELLKTDKEVADFIKRGSLAIYNGLKDS